MTALKGCLLAMAMTWSAAACASPTEETRSDSGPSTSASDEKSEKGEKDSTTTTESPVTTTSAAPVAPVNPASIVLQGAVNVPPGEAGKLSVVAVGAIDGTSVPVIVRNMTDDDLNSLEVTGTARGVDGALVGSGSSQGFHPAVVKPGEWAFGYVYFGIDDIPLGSTFDMTATGESETSFIPSVDLRIAEVNVAPGQYGTQLIGIIENNAGETVSGPIRVSMVCFDEGGTAISTPFDFAEGDELPAGATTSFGVDLFDDPCPVWAVGATGHIM